MSMSRHVAEAEGTQGWDKGLTGGATWLSRWRVLASRCRGWETRGEASHGGWVMAYLAFCFSLIWK